VYVDAGIYRGDGSFFVDGGAYPDAAVGNDGSSVDGADGSTGIDATPGCAPLAACCSSLTGTSLSLCVSVAESGNAGNCAAELTELEGGGDCMGVSVLASEVQVPPNYMVSDGTTLFWTTNATPGLVAMPVHGGSSAVVLSGAVTNTLLGGNSPVVFLYVDAVNVYILQNDGLVRIPKDGNQATLISDPGTLVLAVSVLGSTAYWVEYSGTQYGYETLDVTVKSAPLLGGAALVVGTFSFANPPVDVGVELGLTGAEVFVGARGQQLYDFSRGSGGPSIALAALNAGNNCNSLASDTDAVYCGQQSGSNQRIASDGTTSNLGPAISSSYIVFDDTYAYWVDNTTVGTIMKAPKAGGGTATIVAHDTNPTAIAVDANSVYWADQGGYIKSLPK